jgi:hypothetical protein
MPKLFDAEQAVLDYELAKWYEAIKEFTRTADGIFSEKGKLYDRKSPVWERIRFPHGFVQELEKKTDRLWQLLDTYSESNPSGSLGLSTWAEVQEELRDICNYSRMFGALTAMVLEEGEKSPQLKAEQFFMFLKESLKGKGGGND